MDSGTPSSTTPSSSRAPASALLIRRSTPADVAAITAIYAEAVFHGTGSFELEAPDATDMARRQADVLDKGLPWLVAVSRHAGNSGGDGGDGGDGDDGDAVLGYAYANHFRPRPAYRNTLENSVYLHPEARGRGIGKLLLVELMARAEALGARQMTAVIGDSGNLASVALHRSLGFTHVGTLHNVGRKFDRWLDVVLMQKALGAGAHTPPVL